MTSCWIIECGTYSDYRVIGIYTSKDNADRACAYFKTKDDGWHDDAQVVERPLDPCIKELGEGLVQYGIRITPRETSVREYIDLEPEDMHWNDGSFYHVWAIDGESAIKIAAERHAEWQSNQIILGRV